MSLTVKRLNQDLCEQNIMLIDILLLILNSVFPPSNDHIRINAVKIQLPIAFICM